MKKVKFINIFDGNEVYGWLEDDQGKRLTNSGWWRTTDKVEAAKRAVIVAELDINKINLEII